VSVTRTVSVRFVYDRHAAADTSAAYAILLPPRQARTRRADTDERTNPDDHCGDLRPGSFGQQNNDATIRWQTAAVRAHAEQLGLHVAEERVFQDEGYSGMILARPGLQRLRDTVAGAGVDVVLCDSPDRLARTSAYQALLIEELTRAGTRIEFVNGAPGEWTAVMAFHAGVC
jgi:Resolvase, N terminal domain